MGIPKRLPQLTMAPAYLSMIQKITDGTWGALCCGDANETPHTLRLFAAAASCSPS